MPTDVTKEHRNACDLPQSLEDGRWRSHTADSFPKTNSPVVLYVTLNVLGCKAVFSAPVNAFCYQRSCNNKCEPRRASSAQRLVALSPLAPTSVLPGKPLPPQFFQSQPLQSPKFLLRLKTVSVTTPCICPAYNGTDHALPFQKGGVGAEGGNMDQGKIGVYQGKLQIL